MRVDHEKKSNRVRVYHKRKSDGVKDDNKIKSDVWELTIRKIDGVRVHHYRERWGESSP